MTPPKLWLVPGRATAEGGHKAAMIGEFHETIYFTDEDGIERTRKVPVSWDTIKDICKAFIAASPHRGLLPAEMLERAAFDVYFTGSTYTQEEREFEWKWQVSAEDKEQSRNEARAAFEAAGIECEKEGGSAPDQG